MAGNLQSSEQLKQGLPIFLEQLMNILLVGNDLVPKKIDKKGMKKAVSENNPILIAISSGNLDEVALVKAAGSHGTELHRLGYSLSHVVHAYGDICQAITELTETKKIKITNDEFHNLNRCLDAAIAGAVTEFQLEKTNQDSTKEIEHLGFLAHELRNALTGVTISLQLIKRGTVGLESNTGRVLEKGLKRMETLIDRSLTEVRLRVDPKVQYETIHLLQMVDQLVITAEVEAKAKRQTIEIQIDPQLSMEVDQQLFYSVISNLVHNASKYSNDAAKIIVRGKITGKNVAIEVEDECGGINSNNKVLFKAFVQKNENKSGMGLGLTIAQKSVELLQGKIEVTNLPGKGCIFKVTIPQIASQKKAAA